MSATGGFGSWGHLVGRFFGALSPAGPARADEAWALEHLVQGEQGLWQRMSGPDRRHAVGVAKATVASLGTPTSTRPVVAAALLHDVGKIEPAIGTFSRVAVTLATAGLGRRRVLAWSARRADRPRSWQARTGQYLTHDELGAQLLEAAGSDPLTVTWAREHHMPPGRWSLLRNIAGALKAADGD